MTIQPLEGMIPGGFHDALLHSYAVDLTAKAASTRWFARHIKELICCLPAWSIYA
jgi:hypothetical protein